MSRNLQVLVLCLYALLSFFLASLDPRLAESAVFQTLAGKALFAAVMDTLMLMGFAWAALWIKDLPERRVQTMTALAGTGVFFQSVALPINYLLIQFGEEVGFLSSAIVLLLLGIVIWSIVVIGHIMRHALDVSFPTGAGAALLYTILSIKVSIFIAAN